MKLLFDQNISYRVVSKIKHLLPFCIQVTQIGLENATDFEIWDYAYRNNYTIVTFDADFYDISVLKVHPPKVIWLRFQNVSTQNIADWFIINYQLVTEFITIDDYKNSSCLEVDR